MQPSIPWYQSPVYAGALVSLITQLLVLFGVADKVAPDTVSGAVNAVLQLVAIAAAALAWWKRQRSDIQPIALTKGSAEAKDALRKPDGGYDVRSSGFIGALLAAALVLPLLAGCAGTRQAYQAASSPDEYAYVLAEHYSSLVHEAANLKEKPSTPAEAVRLMQQAELAARPAVLALRDLSAAYVDAKTAENEAALQAAVNRAVQVIADFVRAVQAARGSPGAALDHGPIQTLVHFQTRPLAAGVAL